MSVSVERRLDRSLALFIDGDLQFDSRDEGIYHECLALPALAVAMQRRPDGLRALIIGGGDGLTARELLKSQSVHHIDLVDYDPEVLSLAHDDFQELNQRSLYDDRLKTHIEDAWEFVKRAITNGEQYDVVVSDLTVASDTEGARFHSIAWYENLRRLLGDKGIFAVNCVSPHMTPHAYWCIFNTVRSAGLFALPYHVVIPSFVRQGYGFDWGFMCGSASTITEEELSGVALPEPRTALRDNEHLLQLFRFPRECALVQPLAAPAGGKGEIFLHYFFNGKEVEAKSGDLWHALREDPDLLPLPEADVGWHLLPPEIRQALQPEALSETPASQELFQRVLSLMPALRRYQTRAMVADFLSNPASFLEAIDLEQLVDLLLQRAAELPRHLVDELQNLKKQLVDWSGDYQALMDLGMRAMTIVTLLVIIGNLLYPDAVYGKGEHGGGGHGGDHGGGGRGGDGRGGRGFDGRGFNHAGDRNFDHAWNHDDHWNHWGGWRHAGYWGGWARPWHGWNWGGWGGGWGWGLPYYASGPGFSFNFNSNNNTNNNQATDEEGSTYPVRTYNYQPSTVNNYNYSDTAPEDSGGATSQTAADQGNYRLGPDTDILSNGQIATQLTDKAYMMVTPKTLQVVNQDTGAPIMSLYPDPTLIWHVASEIKRQSLGLQSAQQGKQSGQNWSGSAGFPQQQGEDQNEVQNIGAIVQRLNQAATVVGPPADVAPRPDAPPVPGALEVFASTWMMPDGSFLLIKRPDGSIAYLNGQGWYSDQGKTKLSQPYPKAFKAMAVSYLQNLVNDADSAKNGLAQDQQEANTRMQTLVDDLQQYQSASPQGDQIAQGGDMVEFGSRQLPRAEAIRRAQNQIKRVRRRLDSIQNQLNGIPVETVAANKMLTTLQS